MAETRMWTDHAGGYYVCSHTGCSKKISQSIADHDCCGRCTQGRHCLVNAHDKYAGPGTFPHAYWEVLLRPGVCETCGQSREAHEGTLRRTRP